MSRLQKNARTLHMKRAMKNYHRGNVPNKSITSDDVDATFRMCKWRVRQGLCAAPPVKLMNWWTCSLSVLYVGTRSTKLIAVSTNTSYSSCWSVRWRGNEQFNNRNSSTSPPWGNVRKPAACEPDTCFINQIMTRDHDGQKSTENLRRRVVAVVLSDTWTCQETLIIKAITT